jgi:competence protein ComEA
MPHLTRSELAAYAVCALVVAVVGWRALRSDDQAATARRTDQRVTDQRVRPSLTARAVKGTSVVHVVGAVRRPGVYRVPAGARVETAIARAGGATTTADLQGVNLAAKVSDAQQVVVPARAAVPTPSGGAAAAEPATAAGAAGPSSGAVNLNTATEEQLDGLDGVGPATAQKIIELRKQRGGFRSVDDLAAVPGIGAKRLASLRAQVRV